jgi:hypothetical protein
LAVALATVVLVVLRLHPHATPARGEAFTAEQPLTIGTANALLARSPSAKAAVDDVAAQAFEVHPVRSSEHTQSALAALGKEKTKL